MSDANKTPEPQNDLAAAFSELARQIEAVARAAANSEQVKDLREQVTHSAQQLGTNIENAVKSVQSDPRVQNLEERGRSAWDQVGGHKVVENVQEAITTGLAQLSDRLQKLAEGLQNKDDKNP